MQERGGCVGEWVSAGADAARSNFVRRGESGVALTSTHLDPTLLRLTKAIFGF